MTLSSPNTGQTTPRQDVEVLLDLLTDFENGLGDSAAMIVRDWHGHVAPAISRLRAALSPAPEAGEEVFGVTGASDETEALAYAIFAHRCPGFRMGDEDLPYYVDAAKAAFEAIDAALSSTRSAK